nr:uncharacterized mitochondrial protein AtMg00810-like [Tanacetum cinerariifolium]
MGKLTFFLGLQVKQKKDGTFISHDKYVAEILKKFRFIEVKTESTPMETQKPLLKDEDGKDVDVHMYRSMIGSLMYLTSSRPDIMFVVCACARYQVNPKVSHLYAVNRIFRHLKRTKDETPEVIKNFLKKIYVCLQALVIIVRTDNGTEFKNHILKEYFDSVGITHETSAANTPQQNGVVERRNRTLVEAARTMLIFSHALLFLWAEAIATAYIGKLGAKGDIGFFIGYSAKFVAYKVYNRRTRKIIETMNVTFDELSAMAFERNSSRPGLQKAPRAIPAAPVVHNLQAPTASMSFQDSTSEEGIDFKESFTPVARMEAIRIFFGIHYTQRIHNVSNGRENCISTWFIERRRNGFSKGTIDPTFFTRRFDDDILVVQVYVDDIIFGSTDPRYATLFSDLMKSRFEMSMMGEITFPQ